MSEIIIIAYQLILFVFIIASAALALALKAHITANANNRAIERLEGIKDTREAIEKFKKES